MPCDIKMIVTFTLQEMLILNVSLLLLCHSIWTYVTMPRTWAFVCIRLPVSGSMMLGMLLFTLLKIIPWIGVGLFRGGTDGTLIYSTSPFRIASNHFPV